jgi:cyclase
VAQAAPVRTLHEIADGVFTWLLPGGESGVSNAGVVVDDDGVTVIDTLMVPSQWEPFAEAVKGLGLPIRRVVLSHAHIDHVGGTKAFPHAAVYATKPTSAVLDQPMPTGAYKAFMPAFAEEFDVLEELGTRPATHEVDGAAALTSRIELLPAAGHTDGDLIALVEDADVCFPGDLCFFGVTPLAFQGDPAQWAETLDAVADVAATLVPGHGPIGGEDQAAELSTYLRHCVAAAGDAAAIPPGPWDEWLERDRDEINVERAAMLAAGNKSMPPSMLKAIGLA